MKTQIWTGSGSTYQDVNRWDLTHKFPGTGNSTSPVLWLDEIQRTGKAAGGSKAMPAVTFGGVRLQNRADYDPNSGMANPKKYRIERLAVHVREDGDDDQRGEAVHEGDGHDVEMLAVGVDAHRPADEEDSPR